MSVMMCHVLTFARFQLLFKYYWTNFDSNIEKTIPVPLSLAKNDAIFMNLLYSRTSDKLYAYTVVMVSWVCKFCGPLVSGSDARVGLYGSYSENWNTFCGGLRHKWYFKIFSLNINTKGMLDVWFFFLHELSYMFI